MTSFIRKTLDNLISRYSDISDFVIILPSKRAGNYFTKELARTTSKTIFAPRIESIEEFVKELSGLELASSIDLLFTFYEAYLKVTDKDNVESFKSVSSWANLLIGDFNEIDRFLVESDQLFKYLGAIKELSSWSVDGQQTDSVKNYLTFWKKLETYYSEFNNSLINKTKGHQGLLYREAVHQLENYLASNNKHHVFIGFNALNKAEEVIIKECLQQGRASVYWDIDESFINNLLHDAGHFIRQHRFNWLYFKKHPFNWLDNSYSQPKTIEIVGCTKQIGQVKYIGELLSNLIHENGNLNNTAVVLGDESMLQPLLYSLPLGIDQLNITMGLPLKNSSLAYLFELLLKVHKTSTKRFYYKEVIALLQHPIVQKLENFDGIISLIQKQNIVSITKDDLKIKGEEVSDFISIVFNNWEGNPKLALEKILEVISILKQALSKNKKANEIEMEFLYRFYKIFNELRTISSEYNHINDIQTLHNIYKELVSTETLDFQGNPYQGLQIMGMLESRVLDFETVIITSVNEGVLPAGKSNNSFIPFEAKISNGLPTYKEKDAVYTYHFYHLLQRAKNVFITYNTEPDALNGGEMSRFIRQLEFEGIHKIQHKVVAQKIKALGNNIKTVTKTGELLQDLKLAAQKGLSPSSLTNYIRNPIDFYYEKCLGVKVFDEVEETIASNTLGNIIHKTLEDLYTPFLGEALQVIDLQNAKQDIEETTKNNFKAELKKGDFTKGKNRIIFEVAKRYINNFISNEIEDLKKGSSIEIVALEKQLKTQLEFSGLGFPITIKGIVDRIDRRNGVLRIIDYKTGKVDQGKVEVVNWEDLNTDYDKHSKSFQVLTYAYMFSIEESITQPMEAGIISFKNLKNGFLKFGKKDRAGAYAKKETLITNETLDNFFKQLKALILEIFNPDIPFTEKEI